MPALPVHVGDPAYTQQFCDYLSLFQEGEQSGSGQHVLSNFHFRGMEGKERSNPFCHRTARGGRKHTGKRRKLELSKGVVNILQSNVTTWSKHARHCILTSDFDATLISETHLGKEGLLARAAQQQTLLKVRVQGCSHWSENVGFPSPCQFAVTMLVFSPRLAGRVTRVMGREILLLTAYFEHSVGFRSDIHANLMQDVCFLTRNGRFSFIFGCGFQLSAKSVARSVSARRWHLDQANWVHRWSFRKAPRTRVGRVEAQNPTSSITSWCLHAFGP